MSFLLGHRLMLGLAVLKCCPKCQRLYDADSGFCPIDGGKLAIAAEVPLLGDPDDPRIGTAICNGRFEIRRKVADGGMGRVYQARDLLHETNVAVKVLHQDVVVDDVALERFRREYQLSTELPHDHIVDVRDFQATEDHSFALVMEYLEGEELRMLLKREKTIAPHRLVRILSQLAIGLEEPHQRKLVHRDIKPDNIFLCHTPDGPVVKLLDFGSVRDNAEGAKKLTMIGTTIGSPYYMSPEQAQGLAELDHRADVWSLAAICFEALTGTVPFQGRTGPQILLAILGQEPEPASQAAKDHPVPPPVDDVFAQALTKEASGRHASVAALADDFGAAYGLEGSHRQWAYMAEMQLETLIEQNLPRMMAQTSRRAEIDAALGFPTPSQSGANEFRHDAEAFQDEEFAMGVPTGTPTSWYVGAGLGAAVLIGTVVFLFLR